MDGPAIAPSQNKEWQYKNLDEASRNSRGIFYLYLGALSYCFLTVVSLSDRQLLLGDRTRLPFVNMEVPLKGFLYVAPLLLIMVYVYFQLYLQHMNGLKGKLRVSGNWEYSRAYPWMINIADNTDRGIIGGAQRFVVGFCLWWSLPIVLETFYVLILKRHDKVLSIALFYESAFGVIVVFAFWVKYRLRSTMALVLMMIGMSLLFFAPHAIVGPLWPYIPKRIVGDWDPRNLDLSFQNLVPEGNAKYGGLRLVDLRGLDLRWAKLNSSVPIRADFRNAQLQHANLEGADIQRAWFDGAILDSARLTNASLDSSTRHGTTFIGANLSGSKMSGSTLVKVDFENANLERAKFKNSNLDRISFKKARVLGTDFSHSNMWHANICETQIFENALLAGANAPGACINITEPSGGVFDSVKMSGARFKGHLTNTNFRGADLRSADFSRKALRGANFSGSDLSGASLQGAYLGSAKLVQTKLMNTRLDYATLTGAVVTLEQLSQASTLYQAKLDSSVVKKVSKGSRVWELMQYPFEGPQPSHMSPPKPRTTGSP